MSLLETRGDYEFSERLNANLRDLTEAVNRLSKKFEMPKTPKRDVETALTKAVDIMEEWLNMFSDHYEISQIELKAEGEYRFYVELDGESRFFTVNRKALLNDQGEDVVDVGKSAYNFDKDLSRWLETFEQKWFGKEETR